MPAFELREHSLIHGYTVLGRYPSVEGARTKANALVAEDRQRLGRYTIEYTQQAEPDPDPEPTAQEGPNEMGLRRTKVAPGQDLQGRDVPKDRAADAITEAAEDVGATTPPAPALKPAGTAREAVEAADDKPVRVSEAAREAGARKP